jgi:hypothetical protein
MHLPLYKALLSIKLDEQTATDLVKAMDAHIDHRVNAAMQPILARLESMQTVLVGKIDAALIEKANSEKAKDNRVRLGQWVIGSAIATTGVLLAGLKAFGVI